MIRFTAFLTVLSIMLSLWGCSAQTNDTAQTDQTNNVQKSLSATQDSDNLQEPKTEESSEADPEEIVSEKDIADEVDVLESESLEYSLLDWLTPKDMALFAVYGREKYYYYSAILSPDSKEIDFYLKDAEYIGDSLEKSVTSPTEPNIIPWQPLNDLECNGVAGGTPLYRSGDSIIAAFSEPIFQNDHFEPNEAGEIVNTPVYSHGIIFKKCTGIHLHVGEKAVRSDDKGVWLTDSRQINSCASWIKSLCLLPSSEEEYNACSNGSEFSYTFTCPETQNKFTYTNGAVKCDEGYYKAENPADPPITFPIDSDILADCAQITPHIHPAERIIIKKWSDTAEDDEHRCIITSENYDDAVILTPDKIPELNAWLGSLGLTPTDSVTEQRTIPMYEISYPNSIHPTLIYYEGGRMEIGLPGNMGSLDNMYISANPQTPPGF